MIWLLLAALGCGGPPDAGGAGEEAAAEPSVVAAAGAVAEPEPEPPEVELVIAAVGDVLPHRNVKAAAAARGWEAVFADVAPELREADVAFANLEGPLAPVANRGIHGEVFNAPADLADGLAAAGVDVVSFANNHAWDQGPAGLVETLENLERAGVRHAGAGRTCAEARAGTVLEVRGVRVGFLAVTDLSNLDEGAGPDAPCVFLAGAVCEGDCGPDRDAIHYRPEPERILEAVRAMDADVVVLSFHWGDEYRTVPLAEYPALARTLIDGGVDVILGHHPHVLQTVETIRTASGREGLVAYSLGNFVSNMAASYDRSRDAVGRGHTRDGAILQVRLAARPGGDGPRIVEAALVPTWTHNDSKDPGRTGAPDLRPVPLSRLAARDPELAALRRQAVVEVVGEAWLPRDDATGRD